MSQKTKNPAAAKDTSPSIHQRPKLKKSVALRELDWTAKQKSFIDLALDRKTQLMLIKGPAGTSKTAISVFCSLLLLNQKAVSDIVLVRSIVESSDNKMGFLPGSADEKMYPYLIPFYDKLEMFLQKNDLQYLESENHLSAYPIGFLRGMDFRVRALVCDESQNMTKKELLTFMTRIGRFCKTFILGDPSQSDIKGSGFDAVFNAFNSYEAEDQGIFCFEFTEEDVMRSDLCKYIAKKFKEIN